MIAIAYNFQFQEFQKKFDAAFGKDGAKLVDMPLKVRNPG